jgi:septum formation protein
MKLTLASGSPRRRDLLARITQDFEIVASGAEESQSGPPRERVVASARAKARAVTRDREGLILGADTLVVLEGLALGKPRSKEEARQMLRRLSGRTHGVLTGLCLLSTETGEERTAVEETIVRFRDLRDEEIDAYVRSGEPLDKAGAYAIQGGAALFVDKVEGDFYNVIGLPLCRTALLLREMGLRV